MQHPHLKIPRVIDAFGQVHEVSDMDQSSITYRILDQNFFRCANCNERLIFKAGGPRRQRHFAHYRMIDGTAECCWRTPGDGGFSERNRLGEDGAWHIDVQMALMEILSIMGVHAERNAAITEYADQRRPDVSCNIEGQEVRFEVQASLPDIQSMQRRSAVDLGDGVETLWIVGMRAVRDYGLQSWQHNLLERGGGQLWAWDEECLLRSRSDRTLMIKRILPNEDTQIIRFVDHLPINLGYICKVSRQRRNPTIEFFSRHRINSDLLSTEAMEGLKTRLAHDGVRT